MAQTVLEQLAIKFNVDIKDLQKGFNQAKKEVESLEKNVKDQTDGIKKHFQNIAAGLAAVQLGSSLKGAVAEAIEFEKGLANVSTMLDSKSLPMIKQYKDEILDMSVKYGQATSVLADGLYNLLSRQVPVNDAMNVMAQAAQAACAGVTDTKTAADLLTGTMAQYKMEMSEASKVSDIMFMTVKNGVTTFPELASSMGQVNSLAASVGISLEEVSASLSTITRNGSTTSEAVTGLKGAITTFLNASNEAKQVAAEYGIELSANTLKSEGFLNVIQKMNNTITDKGPLVQEVFKGQTEALTAMLKLTGDMDGAMSDYNKALNATGSTQEAFTKQMNTTQYNLERFNAQISALKIRFADDLLPYLSKFLEWFIDIDLAFSAGIIQFETFFANTINKFKGWVASIYELLGKLPGQIGASYREMAANIRGEIATSEEYIKNITSVWEEEYAKRHDINLNEKEDLKNTSLALKSVSESSKKAGESLTDTSKELEKTKDAAEKTAEDWQNAWNRYLNDGVLKDAGDNVGNLTTATIDLGEKTKSVMKDILDGDEKALEKQLASFKTLDERRAFLAEHAAALEKKKNDLILYDEMSTTEKILLLKEQYAEEKERLDEKLIKGESGTIKKLMDLNKDYYDKLEDLEKDNLKEQEKANRQKIDSALSYANASKSSSADATSSVISDHQNQAREIQKLSEETTATIIGNTKIQVEAYKDAADQIGGITRLSDWGTVESAEKATKARNEIFISSSDQIVAWNEQTHRRYTFGAFESLLEGFSSRVEKYYSDMELYLEGILKIPPALPRASSELADINQNLFQNSINVDRLSESARTAWDFMKNAHAEVAGIGSDLRTVAQETSEFLGTAIEIQKANLQTLQAQLDKFKSSVSVGGSPEKRGQSSSSEVPFGGAFLDESSLPFGGAFLEGYGIPQLMPGNSIIQSDTINNTNSVINNSFSFQVPDSGMTKDLKKWVMDEIVPVLKQAQAQGRL